MSNSVDAHQNPMKWVSNRIWPGLTVIERGVVIGVLFGSIAALLLPTVRALCLAGWNAVAAFPATHLGQSLSPWLRFIVAPSHFWISFVVLFLSLLLLLGSQLWRFLVRFYTFSIYEGTVLWFASSLVFFTVESWWSRGFVLLVALAFTGLIAYKRAAKTNRVQPLIASDRPIQSFSEDKLDRQSLVVALVTRLLDDSVPVIAIVGGYGDGKTSLLNLIHERLDSEDVVTVRFKSSLPGDDLTLVSTLFNSIGQQLHRRFFIRRLNRVLNRFARKFAGLFPSAPAGLKELFSEPSQESQLLELTLRLETLPVRRVAVLLDDMDRMQGEELRVLLRIIRAADSYPTLSFVCAMSKKALVDSLIRHQVVNRISVDYSSKDASKPTGSLLGEFAADDTRAGYEYLEKFFPVQVPVPKLDDAQASREFDLRFHKFQESAGLSTLPEATTEFNEQFQRLWKSHFLPSLNNIRKMNTYFNALNSSFNLVKGEVNVIDFMCIELLRQVEPEVYEQVYKNRSLFYYPEWDLLRWDERRSGLESKKKERQAAEFDQVFRHLYGDEREFTLSLLAQLFPKVEEYHSSHTSLGPVERSEPEADKQNRIFHPDHFATYFSFHVPEGYCSTLELETLLADGDRTGNPDATKQLFSEYLRKMNGIKRYRFFEKAVRFEERFTPLASKGMALAIAAQAHMVQHDDLDIGEFAGAARLVLVLANRLRDGRGIADVLEAVIMQSTTEALAQRVFQFATDRERNKIFQDWTFVNFDELKNSFAARMKSKYFVGGQKSIYAPPTTYRDWQALIWWAQISEEARSDVRAYLEDEFKKRPASIGKHILWLWNSIGNPDGKALVDNLFPLKRLAELAINHGSAYSTPTEAQFLEKFVKQFGN